MNEIEIVKAMNELSAKELERIIFRAKIILEKKQQMEAEQAAKEKERQRLEKIAAEKRRQEEIAELQRRLKELQSQSVGVQQESNKVMGDNFVMYTASAQTKPAAGPAQHTPSAQPQAPKTVVCPHCRHTNPAGSIFCDNCGQKITVQPAAPAAPKFISCSNCRQQNPAGSVFCTNCGQRITAPAAPAKPVPSTGSNVTQICYADESMKKWELLPGEKIVRNRVTIDLYQPIENGKYQYYMEITNRRILFTRESAAAASAKQNARMAAGLVGSLIAEGVSAAKGGGPKPWLEISLKAVTNCGVRNKKEFFIEAGQTFVLKNHGYEKFLPALVTKAKAER